MATYSITTTALALGTSRKRVENLVNRCSLAGTAAGRQGKARRLRHETILALAAVLELEEALGVRAPVAAALVERLRDGGAPTGALRNGAVFLSLDFDELERSLGARLAEALEIAPRPNRGRPRSRRKERN